jgi:multimeric flavodoxin WrbA
MKVLGFNGSPRIDGTTQHIVKEVLRGADSTGAETKYYTLNELEFQGCQGCRKCKDEGICDLQDDLSPIYQEIIDCDVLVLGSPVYMAYVTGQTKLFLDRFYAFTTRDQVSRLPAGKKCVLILTQGYSDTSAYQNLIKSVSSLISRFGFEMEIQVVGGVYSVEDQGALDGAKHAFLLGKNLA